MSDDERSQLPQPGWDPVTVGYWLAAGEGRLAVPRCSAVRPAPLAPNVGVLLVPIDRVDVGVGPRHRRGVHLHVGATSAPTWTRRSYNIAVIELDGTEGEPVRIMTRVLEVDKDTLVVDLPVRVVFERFDDELAVPFFVPA